MRAEGDCELWEALLEEIARLVAERRFDDLKSLERLLERCCYEGGRLAKRMYARMYATLSLDDRRVAVYGEAPGLGLPADAIPGFTKVCKPC